MTGEPLAPPGGWAVEARFQCTRKQVLDATSVQVYLSASTGGRDNVDWAPYTPSGQLTLVVNGPAGAGFVEGARYALWLQRAELTDLHLDPPTETFGNPAPGGDVSPT